MNSLREEFNHKSEEDRNKFIYLPNTLSKGIIATNNKESLARMIEEYYKLLTSFRFIDAKIYFSDAQSLIEDYDQALKPNIPLDENKKNILKLIQEAIRQSTNILLQDKNQLPGQLLGRLADLENPDLEPFLNQIREWKGYLWLRQIKTKMLTVVSPLVRTIPTGHPAISAVAISPDGKFGLSAGNDSLLKLWDLHSGKILKVLEINETWTCVQKVIEIRDVFEPIIQKAWISSPAISPDGNWALTGTICQYFSSASDKNISVVELWNLARGESVLTFGVGDVHDCINSLALSSGGSLALIGMLKGDLLVCDLEKGKRRDEESLRYDEWVINIQGFNRESIERQYRKTSTWKDVGLRSVALSEDGRWTLAASHKVLKVWDLVEGKLHQIIPLRSTIKVKAMSLGRDGRVRILSNNGSLSSINLKINSQITSENVCRKISKLNDYRPFDYLIKTRRKPIKKIPIKLPYNIVPDAITPDGRWAISHTNYGDIQLWDLSKAQKTTK